jgi:hypothetical protein
MVRVRQSEPRIVKVLRNRSKVAAHATAFHPAVNHRPVLPCLRLWSAYSYASEIMRFISASDPRVRLSGRTKNSQRVERHILSLLPNIHAALVYKVMTRVVTNVYCLLAPEIKARSAPDLVTKH